MPPFGTLFLLKVIASARPRRFWTEPRDDIKDVPVFFAAWLYANQACGEAEAGTVAASD